MADQAENIFSGEAPTNAPLVVSEPSPAFADHLAQIKNEHGEPKYKTVEEALKGLANSQAFIPQLLSEKKQLEEEVISLREKAKKLDNVDDILAKLSQSEPSKSNEQTPQNSGLSEEAVVNLVKKALDASKTEEAQRSNITRVQNSLKEKFGEKTREVVAKKAQELNTTPEAIGQLSVSNPDLVLALFNTASTKPIQPSTSSVNLHGTPAAPELQRPEKSLLLGATSKEQKAFMMKVKEDVYRKYNVTE